MARVLRFFDIQLPDTGIYGKPLKTLHYKGVRAYSPEQALAGILALTGSSFAYPRLLPDINSIVTEMASQQRMF